ncbi:hypothetical protein ACFLY9_00220 [Patescibacteria group bacterium]
MKINVDNIIEKIRHKGNSATILITHKSQDKQLEVAEEISRKILQLSSTKPYKSHPDVFGIWPEHVNGKTIKIEQVHEFIRKTQLKPFSAQYKIGIIISIEKTTKEAQNALLKTLEEPPQNTFLILTTSKKDKLLPTIISRCQVLEQEEKTSVKSDLKTVKRILRGNIIDRFQFVEEITKQKNRTKVFEDVNELTENLLCFFRQRLLKNQKKTEKVEKIIELIGLIETTQAAIERNVNTRLALESLMINLPLKGEDY